MDVAKWLHEQFTEERLLRWMDGHNPKIRYGNRSFVQVLDSTYVFDAKAKRMRRELVPNIWSVVNCGKHNRRSRYYLKILFYPSASIASAVVADLHMWSPGIRGFTPRRAVTSEMTLLACENAPKKLNREIRRLRNVLFAPLAQLDRAADF